MSGTRITAGCLAVGLALVASVRSDGLYPPDQQARIHHRAEIAARERIGDLGRGAVRRIAHPEPERGVVKDRHVSAW